MTNELLEAIDADEAKKIVSLVLDVAGEIASMTPWSWDDKAVVVAKNLVDRPLIWKVVIGLINRALPEGAELDAELLTAVGNEDTAGVDPVTIVTLIMWALPLIKKAIEAWKQRRRGPSPQPAPPVA
jgi:hypothetical protein